MIREMKISGLFMESETDTPVVELTDTDNEIFLHISIGFSEAAAIASELERIRFMRPMTHDLIKNLLTHLEVIVDRVEIHDLRDSTFYAWIYLNVDDKEFRIDARPSDALAIALRMSARIYVNEKLVEESKVAVPGAEEQLKDDESKKWTEILQKLSPEDFGKYKM